MYLCISVTVPCVCSLLFPVALLCYLCYFSLFWCLILCLLIVLTCAPVLSVLVKCSYLSRWLLTVYVFQFLPCSSHVLWVQLHWLLPCRSLPVFAVFVPVLLPVLVLVFYLPDFFRPLIVPFVFLLRSSIWPVKFPFPGALPWTIRPSPCPGHTHLWSKMVMSQLFLLFDGLA